jgi:hypothetical protein
MVVIQYSENEYVQLGTCNFEIMNDYTYLGAVVTNKNELRPDNEKYNYKCQLTIVCTASSTKKISQYSEQKK